MSVKIFCCYAHEDKALLNKLKAHLQPLQRQGLIELWHDRDINAGSEWEREISMQLSTAQIVLLLISPDFMNSNYCYGIEMQRALERHERKEAKVIPVILRRVHWQDVLGRLQALPTEGKPVRNWQDEDDAFFDVVEGIRITVEELTKKPTTSESLVLMQIPNAQQQTSSVEDIEVFPKEPDTKRVNRGVPQRVVVTVLVVLALVVGASGFTWLLRLHSNSNQATATSLTRVPTSFLGIDTLTDDFNSSSVLDTTKWGIYTTAGATIALSGGQQVNTPTKNAVSEATTYSINLYDAIGKSAFIQVLQVSAGSTVDTAFGLRNADVSNAIQIFYSGGELVVGTYMSGRLFTTAYNSTTQKWWRIRESGGTTYADVSHDGKTWANVYKHANFFDMSQARVFTTSDEWDADPTAGAAKFDNFNLN